MADLKANSVTVYPNIFECKKEKWFREWMEHMPKRSREYQDWLNKRIGLVGAMEVFTLDHFISQEVGIRLSSDYDNDEIWDRYEKRMDQEIEKMLRKEKLLKIKSKI